MKLSMKLLTTTALGSLLAATPTLAQTKWDLAAAYPPGNFHTQNLQQFANDVDRATSGKLKITIHSNASLFKAPEIKRAVQTGGAQMGEILMVNYQNEWPIFGADGVPFLADSYDSAMKLYAAQKPLLEKKLGEQGIMLLYAVPWPPQGIYSKTPLNSSADLKGVKIRSYSPTVARMIELMGAQPVTVQAAELTQALATGVVSANITSAATGVDSKSWEQLTYYFDVQAWLPKNVVLVNQKQFDALDKPTQQALLKAAADAEARGWKTSEEKTVWYVDQLKKNNMKVLPPSAELKKDLVAIGDKMTKEWLEKAGADGQAVLDAYRKAKK